MRIEKDNLISFGLTVVITPLYAIWLFLKWTFSQIVEVISMIFSSFKSQLAKLFGGAMVIIIISLLL